MTIRLGFIKEMAFIFIFGATVIPFFAEAKQVSSLLIEDVTLIDGTGRPPIEHVSVLVEGERIKKIVRSSIEHPKGSHVINGSGKYLIPGLMDVHIHLKGGFGLVVDGVKAIKPDRREGIKALHGYIYSGITSVFDAGNVPEHILSLRKAEREGEIVSPRVFSAGGFVTYPGGHGSNETATLIKSWPEAESKLKAHIEHKPDMLKLTYDEHGWGARPMIPRLPIPLMEKVINFYNNHGIRTTVHASSETRAREAIFAGADTLAHPVIQGPISDEFANLMAAKKIPMATTLTIGENYSRLVEHPEFLDQPLYREILEPSEIEKLSTEVRDEYKDQVWTWWMKVMTPVAQENVRRLNEAGAILALGSDQSSGAAAHRELELLVEGGVSPLDAIRIATLNAAIFLGKESDLGSIEEGKLADMVLLSADPSVDINNTKKIVNVFKGGALVDRKSLGLPVNRK